ncbi:MAG TPA: DUF3182 family protein, partial [Dongiaceae bacterium]|nr:DUF3182 family protein [Dongiaceae bacterium]
MVFMVPGEYDKGQVVAYRCRRNQDGISQHEWESHLHLAGRLAALLGYEFAGEYDPDQHYDRLYFVPNATLLHADAQRLGIWREDDLFGGCVAAPFAATKSITHPLVGPDATAPAGWSDAFPWAVADTVLQGVSVFSHADAHKALKRLLVGGQVRLKPSLGVGGAGQSIVANAEELDAALAAIDINTLARYGAVLERNLTQVTTFSVGQVRLNGVCVSYHGTQKLTANRHGEQVYGGSTLQVVRGDYTALLRLPVTTALRLAIDQARRYDAAAVNYLGLLASRRNYDVAQG